MGLGAVDGLRDFAAQLDAGTVAIPSPPAGVKDWPIVGAQLYALWDQASTNLRTALREVAPNLKPLAGTMLGLAGDAGVGTLKFLVAVALTGFLLPAGPRLVAATRRFLSRVVAERSQDFLALAGATIRSVAQGVIGIAVAQGLVIGIILKLADVPRAGLLAFVVMMLGILQIRLGHRRDSRYHLALGHQVLCHRARDHAVPAASLACRQCAETHRDGASGLTTPALVIFLRVIGGTLAHGIVGLFIGPIILAVAWELLTAWVRDDGADVLPAHTEPAAAQQAGKA